MGQRAAAVYVIAGSLAVLVVAGVLTVLPGPSLPFAVAGALGTVVGLALLMAANRDGNVGSATPTDRPGGDGL